MINLIGYNVLNKSFAKPLDNQAIQDLQTRTEQGGVSAIVNISNQAKELQMETKKTDAYIDNFKQQKENFDARVEAYRRTMRL